jgi:competence protein ComEC
MRSAAPPAPGPWAALWTATRHRPLVTGTLAMLAGIVWVVQARQPQDALPWLAALGVAALVAACLCRRWSWLASRLLVTLACFLAGAALFLVQHRVRDTDLVHLSGRTVPQVEATIVEYQRRWAKRPRVVAWTETLGYEGYALLTLPVLRREDQPCSGDRVLVYGVEFYPLAGEPGLSEAKQQDLQDRGAHVAARATALTLLARGDPRPPGDWVLALRGRMERSLEQAMPGPNAVVYSDLLAGMVYGGGEAAASDDVADLFVRSGTFHLLVVSGAQVSLLALVLLFLLRGRRRAVPLWAVPLVGLGLLAFGLVAGLGSSVVRAIAMQVMLLVSFAYGRGYDFPTALALSALGLVVADADLVFRAGPQLTYACTLGVYLAMPAARPGDSLLGHNPFALALRGSLGAWVAATPILVRGTEQLVLLGALANVVAVPLSAIVLYLGLLAIGLGLIWAPLAVPVCVVARSALTLLLASNGFFARLPLAVLDGVTMPAWLAVAWYAAAGSVALGLRSGRPEVAKPGNRGWAVAVGVVIAGGIMWGVGWREVARPAVAVHVLSVGTGQCVLVRAPGGDVLVDAGAPPNLDGDALRARAGLLPHLEMEGVRRLQAVLLTHCHADHCNFVPDLLAALPVQRLLLGPTPPELTDVDADWWWLQRAARERGLTPEPLAAGARLDLGGGAVLEALEPTTLLSGTGADANNNSVVLRLTYGAISVLLPSDIQAEGEQRLLLDYAAHPEVLRSTVLLAAHHGRRTSNTPAFMAAVQPEAIFMSCGRSPLDQEQENLETLVRPGVALWRTAAQGTLRLTTNGRTMRVRADYAPR